MLCYFLSWMYLLEDKMGKDLSPCYTICGNGKVTYNIADNNGDAHRYSFFDCSFQLTLKPFLHVWKIKHTTALFAFLV